MMTTKQRFLKYVGKGKMFSTELTNQEQEYLRELIYQSLHHNSIATALNTLNEWNNDSYLSSIVKEVTGQELYQTIYEALEQITEVIMTEKINNIVDGLRENYRNCCEV